MKAARAVFDTRFSHLGTVRSFRKSSFPASNQHFVAHTDSGKFFVKVVDRPGALYEGNGMRRLRAIATAVVELSQAGLPVERLQAASDGEYLIESAGSAFRVFHFIEGRSFEGGTVELQQAATALGHLHARGREALTKKTECDVEAFPVPYPLCKTKSNLDELQCFLEDKLHLQFGHLLREASMVSASLKKSIPVLVHNDFHPGNVLYGTDIAPTLIDLDNLTFAPALKCAAFAVLRFGVRRSADLTVETLQTTLKLWAPAYQNASGISLGSELYRWMAYVEVEKILRIAARVSQTGGYTSFLQNIAHRHLPNLRLLMAELI